MNKKITYLLIALFLMAFKPQEVLAQCEISASAINVNSPCDGSNTISYDIVVNYNNIPTGGSLQITNFFGVIVSAPIGGLDGPNSHTFSNVTFDQGLGEPDFEINFTNNLTCSVNLHLPLFDCDGCNSGNTIGTYSSQTATNGTKNETSIGSNIFEYILNYNGDVTLLHNNNEAYPNTDAGSPNEYLEYLFYKCEPTPNIHPYTDECIIVDENGLFVKYADNIPAFPNPSFKEISQGNNSAILNLLSPLGLNNNDNKVWVKSILTKSRNSPFGSEQLLDSPINCYETGDAFSIQYLNQIALKESNDCTNNKIVFENVIGGYPEFYGGNFTISIISGNGSLNTTTVAYDGSFELIGLSDGDAYNIKVTDLNGGESTFSGTFSCNSSGSGDEECSTCATPTCPIAGPYTSLTEAESPFNQCANQNTISPNISSPNKFISYHTVVASSTGELGVVITTGYGTGACPLNRNAQLYIPGECTSSSNEILVGKSSSSPIVGEGFEWTGLTPNATYTVVITTEPGIGCSIQDQCVSYYQPTSCSITQITPTIKNQDCTNNTYDVDITVEYAGAPTNGRLFLRNIDTGTNIQSALVNTISSPYTFTVTGLDIDNINHEFGVYFQADNTCNASITVTDPTCTPTCNIFKFTDTNKKCFDENSFTLDFKIEYTNKPSNGSIEFYDVATGDILIDADGNELKDDLSTIGTSPFELNNVILNYRNTAPYAIGVRFINDLDPTITECSLEFTLSEPSKPTTPIAPATIPPICSGETTSFTVTSGTTYNFYSDEELTNLLETNTTGLFTTPILNTNTSYWVTNNETCESTPIKIDIIVNSKPEATVKGDNDICSGTSPIFIITGTPGATVTYNIDGGTPLTETLDSSGVASITGPIVTSDSKITLTLVDDGTCSEILDNSATVTVVPLPTATVISSGDICSGETPSFIITGTIGTTVTYSIDGEVNQTIILTDGTATISGPTVTIDSTISLVSINNGTCLVSLTDTATTVVNALPNATVSAVSSICPGETPSFTITGTTDATVTYSIDGATNQTVILTGGSVVVSGTSVTADSTITLSLINEGACSKNLTETATVTVNTLPTASVTNGTAICSGESPNFTITGTIDATVTYSIDGGANQTIVLKDGTAIVTGSSVTANSKITLSLVNDGTCDKTLTETATVTVNPNIKPTFNPISPICEDSDNPLVSSSIEGITGTWTPIFDSSIIGDTVYTFNPDTGQCVDISTPVVITITIIATSTTSFTAVTPVCEGDIINPLPTASLEGITGTWSPSLDNTETTEYTFTPNPGQCAPEASLVIEVLENPTATIINSCDGPNYTLSALDPDENFTYKWYDASGNLLSEETSIVINTPGTYQITVENNICSVTETITVNSVFCQIPKGLSPNGDGLNDTWELTNFDVKKVQIFNRYGVEVYSKANYTNEWDGTSNGNELPSATYYYIIEFNNNTTKTGWVYLNR
jgi:gliding motility-associated-like protein